MKIKKKIKKELSKKEYQSFIKEVIDYNTKKGNMPPHIIVDDTKIYKNEYIEAIENVNKFILENGRQPETVSIYAKRRKD
ncbi:pseudomurein-binding repeat-containing protein [Methanosphaera sp. WGK6]|uniref:pseudomurein-binding repeat-containing protein n=1 Tax=Methanosphaera sp. WGK6 TaxID=1561964 RepID=UPI00084C31BF|nr:pseudomurein-binding repeat-containing protein [Methanosphaera sp. WGK6]OED30039.1 hypothetical protein NL43_04780 [Methanosphaera sp. WGK6]